MKKLFSVILLSLITLSALAQNTVTPVRIVDTYINRLRRKIGPYADNVVTKDGEGYCFE